MPATPSLLILHPRLTFSLRHFSFSSPSFRTRRLALLKTYCSSSSAANLNENARSGRSGSLSSPPTPPPSVLDSVQRIDVNPPKGTRDFPPEEMRLRNWLFQNFREVSQMFAFEEVDFPVLESEALFIRKAGEEIRDQLYCFEDRGNRRVALRPELTPSLARLVIQKGKSLSLPLKWFAIGQCWRYERMTRGRRREHYQWNMDIIGVSDVTAEAELISSIITFFKRIGITASDVGFKVSSRKVQMEPFLVVYDFSILDNIDDDLELPADRLKQGLLGLLLVSWVSKLERGSLTGWAFGEVDGRWGHLVARNFMLHTQRERLAAVLGTVRKIRSINFWSFVDFKIRIKGLSHYALGVKVLQEVLRCYSIPENLFGKVCIIIDKIEKIPIDEIKKELRSAELSDEAIEELLQVLSLKSLTKLEEKLGEAGEAVADLKQLFSLAENFGYSEWIQFDASVVRGLAYYTGIVFEGFDREGKLRAICGGGRYDRLLSTFGGDDIPACGFGFGDAVIIELLKEKGLIPEVGPQVENIVCYLDGDLQGAASAVATILRGKGQSVDLILENKPLKWVFKRAARINAHRLILVGSSEWQKGMVRVKILSSGEQYEIKVDELE
ncbi:unnamed protein product [Ilex paraguariensis]|uniref:histidine--tRNA ligase n=1 Tax=Ilex paraguariensis TaxID=185542 RepID=A0ABC8SY39_9AQUA